MYPDLAKGYVIENISIIDVIRAVTLPGKTVVVSNERIQSIHDTQSIKFSGNFQSIDGSGLFLIPGLIDAHVHYFDPVTFGPLLLRNGIVFVRDMGNPTNQALQLRQALKEGTIPGPELITTGCILDGDPPQIPPISLTCTSAEQGRERVRQQLNAGVDQIKVYSDLEKEVYLAIIEETRLHGMKPVGHVPEAVYIEDAARAGQATCEHMFGFEKMIGRFLGEEVKIQKGGMASYIHYWMRLPEVDPNLLVLELKKIKETGMAVCPTLVVFFGHARAKEILSGTFPFLETVSPQIRNIWNMLWNPTESEIDLYQKVSPFMQAFVFELYKAGFPLLVGTDLTTFSIIPGYSLHEEMRLWQQVGIPPVDVLRSATITPARFFNRESDLGTIEPGKLASMVLVRGNPLVDISHAADIAAVFLRGEPVYTTI